MSRANKNRAILLFPHDMEIYQLENCDKVCLLPRLSLTELIHVSGLVRSICERSTDVMLLAKRDHVRPLRCLYGDLPNVRFQFVDSWDQLYSAASAGSDSLLDKLEKMQYRVVPLPSFREACPYTMLGLASSLAVSNFKLQRNLDDERHLLDKVVEAVGSTFVVVHDDDRAIRKDLMPDGLPRVHVRDPRFRTPNPFDWIQVIDQAVQFHGIDSCFLMIADVLALRCRKFCHAYAYPTSHPLRPAAYRDVVVVWG